MERQERVSLPLLAKELVEMSARPRTYLVRVAYAAVLLLISWLVLYSNIPKGATALDVLGKGTWVLQGVGYMQNIGLQLVLPAIACGAFTIEKERNTLGLLFLTRLGPWTILFEKLLSRLLLAVSFLIISMPVLSFSYALGGITQDRMWAHFLSLCLTAVYIVCISVMCSSYYRTTAGALIATYLLVYLTRLAITAATLILFSGGGGYTLEALSWELVWGALFTGSDVTGSFAAGPNASRLASLAVIAIPWLLVCVVCLLLSRWFLVARAFLQPRNPLREFFRGLDRLFERANNNFLTRGIVIVKPKERLPDGNPVAWRETTTRSLGQARYLVRILLVLEVPLFLVLLQALLDGNSDKIRIVTVVVQTLMWLAMSLITCVLSAGLISGERGRQTLDVLLTTPLHAPDIVQEKMAGVMRLIWICEVPMWTCVAFRYYFDGNFLYVVAQGAMLLIYPRLIAWVSMWHGLRSKSALAAIVKSLLAIVWRCVGPFVVMYAFVIMFLIGQPVGANVDEIIMSLTWASPVTLMVVSEFLEDFNGAHVPFAFQPVVCLVMTTTIQGAMLGWAWWRCIDRSHVLLGRAHGEPGGMLRDIFVAPSRSSH